MDKSKQASFFKSSQKSYGGQLLKTRKGRAQGRPLSTRKSMHLVLRSSKAKADWSFRQHQGRVQRIISHFSKKYSIRIYSLANVGNHLHLHLQLGHRSSYRPFIRAITSSIAMAVTGASRWQPMKEILANRGLTGAFWDYRPFSRVILGRQAYLNVKDYLEINRWEGLGLGRTLARWRVTQRYFASG